MKTNGSKSAFLEHEFTEKTYEVRKDTPNTLSFQVRKMSTANKVHLNLEDLPTELHGPFVQHIIADFVKLHKAGVQKFQLNNVTEDAFRNVLNMPIRKLGYTSKFTRCNKDRGLAYFERLAVMDQCPNCDKGGDKNLLK
ncbi:hypothetical protein DPMN_010524 [Dreissena polymorpha]|uniref:Uncharacterized protein n=2 Tax=Dreissena polymorpha TaxID=45954 RepID=A0A9D4S142_DREPO|nr:hypothetical protein DPMN_010524 [Dreissena polymorpha]